MHHENLNETRTHAIGAEDVATAAYTLQYNLIISASRGLLATARLSCFSVTVATVV